MVHEPQHPTDAGDGTQPGQRTAAAGGTQPEHPDGPGGGAQPEEAERLRESLRSPGYRKALVFSALIGVPVSLAAFWFLAGLHELEHQLWDELPRQLGWDTPPWWWPLPLLTIAGLVVGLVVRHLKGAGGHLPAGGLHAGGTTPAALPGILLAALASLPFGAVLGPEAPLIALGGGLALLFARLARAPASPRSAALLGAAGAAAALSAIFGNPVIGAVILIEVAGVGGPQLFAVMLPALLAPLTEMTLAQWQKVLDVNLTGQFLCAREASKEFVRRGVVPEVSRSAGKIICMSSVHQVIPWSGHVNYAASKGGVQMMMATLAQELAPKKIRVNAIAPGAIRTPINRDAWDTPEAEDDLLRLIPYDRVGDPEDIAYAAVSLASDLMDYVVGTTLYVDGGMTLFPGFATGG